MTTRELRVRAKKHEKKLAVIAMRLVKFAGILYLALTMVLGSVAASIALEPTADQAALNPRTSFRLSELDDDDDPDDPLDTDNDGIDTPYTDNDGIDTTDNDGRSRTR